MISDLSKSKNNEASPIKDDPFFLLAELLIKIDKREKIVPQETEVVSDENKRSSDNAS